MTSVLLRNGSVHIGDGFANVRRPVHSKRANRAGAMSEIDIGIRTSNEA
jgi:hypothetical protein